MRMGLRMGLNVIGSVLGDAGKVDFEPESGVSDQGIKVAVPGILNLGRLSPADSSRKKRRSQ